jgi:DNA (cytosine-5)-methyltransferase 1
MADAQSTPTYYNEHDPFAAAWLRQLIAGGHIPDGYVDERDIQDIQPGDLSGFQQCHFFAGIGGWALALELAAWGDRPVWTGSCPCQPYSSAGKGEGAADARNLWPAWFRLIRECRPVTVFGEQVEAAVRHGWLDAVSSDVEAEGYAFGAVVLGAHSVGAPHIRQRLWWVADAERGAAERRRYDMAGQTRGAQGGAQERERLRPDIRAGRDHGGLAEPLHPERRPLHVGGQDGRDGQDDGRAEAHGQLGARGEVLVVGDSHNERPQGRDGRGHGSGQRSPWSAGVALACSDGRSRIAEPGIFPLAHGVPNRVGALRGAGNAIVPQVAAEFIRAYVDVRSGSPLQKEPVMR